jgi:CheY-like chemotaxis protein
MPDFLDKVCSSSCLLGCNADGVEDYRILRAGSGQAALDTCKQLKGRGDVVALFLSDQRMPGMTGVEFFEQVIALYPDAKRVLLTAYTALKPPSEP